MHANTVVQVASGRSAGRPDLGDLTSDVNILTDVNEDAAVDDVTVLGLDAVPVVYANEVSVDAVPAGVDNATGVRGVDGSVAACAEVGAEVEGNSAATEGVYSVAKSARDPTARRPGPAGGTYLSSAELRAAADAGANSCEVVSLGRGPALGENDELSLELVLVSLLRLEGVRCVIRGFLSDREGGLGFLLVFLPNVFRDVCLVGEGLGRLLILQRLLVNAGSLLRELVCHPETIEQVVCFRRIDEKCCADVSIAGAVELGNHFPSAIDGCLSQSLRVIRLLLQFARLEGRLLEFLVSLLVDGSLGFRLCLR
jgi:hypothetical protein